MKIFQISGYKVAVGINDRNPKYHDIFILDTRNSSLTKLFQNDHFSRFTFDDTLKIAFKEEVHDDGSIDIYKNNRVYFHFSPEDAFHSHLVKVHGTTLYYLDSRDSDTTWLKSVDLKTGTEFKLANNPRSDINDIIFVDGSPVMYSTTWLKKEWHPLGTKRFELLQKRLGSNFEVISQSKNSWVIRAYEAKRIGASFYLYNLDKEQLTPLYRAESNSRFA